MFDYAAHTAAQVTARDGEDHIRERAAAKSCHGPGLATRGNQKCAAAFHGISEQIVGGQIYDADDRNAVLGKADLDAKITVMFYKTGGSVYWVDYPNTSLR